MKRRDLIKKTTLAVISPGLFSWIATQPEIDFQEIIGKKKPVLTGDGFKLRKEAAKAFENMRGEALKEGIDLYSVSSYRSFQDQKRIWNNKYIRFTGEGSSPEEAISRIIEYSTIPGTSRHHWGTDIDVVDGNQDVSGDRLLAHLFGEGQPYEKLKSWLDTHASKYGFLEVYTNLPERKGFKYEPWHLSYEPLSKPFLKRYMEIDFSELLRALSIEGSSRFSDDFIRQYWKENMLDINPTLLPA